MMTIHIRVLIPSRKLIEHLLFTRCTATYRKHRGEKTRSPAFKEVWSKWKLHKQTERCCNSQNAFGRGKEVKACWRSKEILHKRAKTYVDNNKRQYEKKISCIRAERLGVIYLCTSKLLIL